MTATRRRPDARPVPTALVSPAFLALVTAGITFFVAAGVVLPVASPYARDVLRADSLGVGVAIGSFSVAALVLRPVVGWSADRFGRRPLLIAGALLNVAALALHLVAFNLPLFLVARSLLGAAEGFFLVAMISAGSDLAPAARRGEALSFLSLTLYLGVAVGPVIGETVLGAASYPWVWASGGAIALLALIPTLLVPETAPGRRERSDPDSDPAVAALSVEARSVGLLHPAGILPGLITLLGLIGMAAFFTYLPLYGREAGLDGVALPLIAYAVVVIVLRIVGATWPDRFGAVRVSGGALLVGALGLAVIGLVPTAAGLLVGTGIFAAGIAFLVPALLSLAVSLVHPDERGRVVGTASVFWDLSLGLGPVALGFVAAGAGYGAAFTVSALVSLLGFGLLVVRRRSLVAPVDLAPATAPERLVAGQ